MPSAKHRVLLVATHPVPYQAPLFRRMAQHPQLDIQVAYCSLQSVEAALDPEFGVNVAWDVPLLDGYPWMLVPHISSQPRLGQFFGLVNPGLWKLVSSRNYDAVVTYTGYAYLSFWVVALAAKLHHIPLLFGTDATSLQPRSSSRWKTLVKRILLPRIFRLATILIAPSNATEEHLCSLGVPKGRIVATPFVVDNEYWKSRASKIDRAAARQDLQIPDGHSVVLFCAKLQPWKRPQDILRAFARANVPASVLIMAGEGPMRSQLETEARDLRVAHRVRFLGFTNQSRLPKLYCAADLMVLPSEYDPCPAVVCEAMLCGCPVILSDRIRGRLELVRPGETGFVYPCGDTSALAAILETVLVDSIKLRQLSRASQLCMEEWSPSKNVQGLVQAVGRSVAWARGRRPMTAAP